MTKHEKVNIAKEMLKSGYTISEIGRRFKVSRQAVHQWIYPQAKKQLITLTCLKCGDKIKVGRLFDRNGKIDQTYLKILSSWWPGIVFNDDHKTADVVCHQCRDRELKQVIREQIKSAKQNTPTHGTD